MRIIDVANSLKDIEERLKKIEQQKAKLTSELTRKLNRKETSNRKKRTWALIKLGLLTLDLLRDTDFYHENKMEDKIFNSLTEKDKKIIKSNNVKYKKDIEDLESYLQIIEEDIIECKEYRPTDDLEKHKESYMKAIKESYMKALAEMLKPH